MTAKEYAALLGMSEWAVYNAVREGRGIPHVPIGRRICFPRDAVRRWLDGQGSTEPVSAGAGAAERSAASP